jgi:hypothetical protein
MFPSAPTQGSYSTMANAAQHRKLRFKRYPVYFNQLQYDSGLSYSHDVAANTRRVPGGGCGSILSLALAESAF